MHRCTQTSQVDASRYSTSHFPRFVCYKILHQLMDVDTISSYLQQVSWVWLEFSSCQWTCCSRAFCLPERTKLYRQTTYCAALMAAMCSGNATSENGVAILKGSLVEKFPVFRVQKSQQTQRTVKKPREEEHETKRTKGEDQKREKYKKKQSTLKNRT